MTDEAPVLPEPVHTALVLREFSNAWFTLEKAWFSGRQIYVLYTVKEPNGKLIMPTKWEALPKGRNSHGQTDWNHLSNWGGVSSGGFHSVQVFNRFDSPPQGEQLKFQIMQWAPVSPEKGMDSPLPCLPARASQCCCSGCIWARRCVT